MTEVEVPSQKDCDYVDEYYGPWRDVDCPHDDCNRSYNGIHIPRGCNIEGEVVATCRACEREFELKIISKNNE